MVAWSLLRVALHIARGLFICILVFPRIAEAARQAHIQRWSAHLLRLFRVRLEVLRLEADGSLTPVPVPVMPFAGADAPAASAATRNIIVANHVSWLDIFVIDSMQPCRFVAKSDIRDWPLLGTLCARANTIFISRGRPRDVRKTFRDLVTSVQAGERVAFFPEGTTAAQGMLLPFHANLFEAAIDAGVPVQPLALRYFDAEGRLDPAVDYIGETTFLESMLTILRGRPVLAQILLLPPIASTATHRRVLAATAHEHIGAALGYRPVPAAPADAGA
jgi:1-acyl-sn-glycerol-3-phosphate acyltransferase